MQTALLQGQSGTGRAAEPVHALQLQPPQQQQSFAQPEVWDLVRQKFGGQPPGWVHSAFSMWRNLPADMYGAWLAAVNRSQVSIQSGQHL